MDQQDRTAAAHEGIGPPAVAEGVLAHLRAAGAAAVEVNAPTSPERMAVLVDRAVDLLPPAGEVVDLGCGHGALLIALLTALGPSSTGLGIDLDPVAVAAATARVQDAGLGDRCTVQQADATTHHGRHDLAVCVGSSHAFGGLVRALDRMVDLTRPGGVALVGDAVWATRPDRWCRSTFGDLPTRDDVVEMAEQLGWSVADVDGSTLAEWDAFESAWTAGVESVGTGPARAFAEQRRREYARYRGVLGFTWLLLRHP